MSVQADRAAVVDAFAAFCCGDRAG